MAKAKATKLVEPIPDNSSRPSVRDRLDSKFYETKLPYATMRQDPVAHKAYGEDVARLEDEFRNDALVECGIASHPNAGKCFSLAWSRGHAYGYEEVFNALQELSELLK